MSGTGPVSRPEAGQIGQGRSELALRIASAVVLAPLALAAAYMGGWAFALFWAVAAVGVLWEWTTLVAGQRMRAAFAVGSVALAIALALIPTRPLAAIGALAAGAVLAAVLSPAGRPIWCGCGVIYSGAVLVAPVLLRADPDYGLFAIVLLFVVVWATDIVAYFAGRMLGGPKLAPQISPKKTWSGAIGGAAAAVLAAIAASMLVGLGRIPVLAAIALVLSIAAQAGDLFESAIKRRFGAKDAGQIIPGHGGLMDRLDGFIAAAVAAAIVGVLRGGADASARGLLVW